MDHYLNASAQPGEQPDWSDRLRHSKALIPTLAVMLVAVSALATTLVVTRSNAGVNDVPAVLAPSLLDAPLATTPAPVGAPSILAQAVPAGPAMRATAPVVYSAPQPVYKAAPVHVENAAPVYVAQAPVCHNCGVVESVVAVQRHGQAHGIAGTPVTPGMAIGGVVGGLLGNQVGHGNGRTAATLLGAAGGAYAGKAIENNSVKYTAYEMRVRMNDGSIRTVEQRSAVAAGSRVVVENGAVRVRSAQS